MALKDKMIQHLIEEIEFLGMEEKIIGLFGYEWKETLNDDESNEMFYFNISVITREIANWYGE